MISPPYREPDMLGFEATSKGEAYFSLFYLIKFRAVEIKTNPYPGTVAEWL
jgi:hypothetical protein